MNITDKSIEELADLLELIYAAAIALGHTLEELELVRFQNANCVGDSKRKSS